MLMQHHSRYKWVAYESVWLHGYSSFEISQWEHKPDQSLKAFIFLLVFDPNKPKPLMWKHPKIFKSGSRCRLRWSSIRDGGKPKNVYFCNDSKPMWHVSCCVLLLNSSRVLFTVCFVPTGATQSVIWDSLKLFAFLSCSENFASPGHCICVWIIALKSNAGLWSLLSCLFQLCKNLSCLNYKDGFAALV